MPNRAADTFDMNSARPLATFAAASLLTVMGFSVPAGAASTTLTGTEFQTPSGNIHCAFYDSELRCDLSKNTAPVPARPADCELDWGNAFYLPVSGKGGRGCVGDTVANPDNPILKYGAKWKRSGITCTSAASGLACTNRTGRKMFLSAGTQTLS